jgi:hypothetical protein
MTMAIKSIDGLPVLDAKRPLKLSVTMADIKKANPKQSNECAIARACARELHVKEARIHLGRIYLRTNDHNWLRYQTPKAARNEIIAFDRGGTFEPLELKLLPVCPSERLGVERGPRSPHKGKGKKRAAPHVVTNVRGGPA